MNTGASKSAATVIIGMVPVIVPISHFMGIKRLISVIGMSDPLRNRKRGHIKGSGGFSSFGVVI